MKIKCIILSSLFVLSACSSDSSLTSDEKLDQIETVINSDRSVWDISCDFYYSHHGDEKYAKHVDECERKVGLLYAALKEKGIVKNQSIDDLKNPELWQKFQAKFPKRAFYYTGF
jgi:hypothetical protein